MKRILAVFLTLAMALNIAPMAAFAAADSDAASIVAVEETDENASPQLDEETAKAIASDPFLQQLQSGAEQPKPEADPNEIQVSGNGVLGNMLAARINALNEENGVGYSPDYGITEIVMDGNRATVSYNSAEEANLVVALYTEDTQEMVASGTMRVPAAVNGTAELTIADVPAYYVVKGYLLNEEYAPLCNNYTKSLYTEAMDQIKNATTDDFEEDRVLNLDQNLDTNFMVVNEDVSLMKDAASDVYADDDNQIYKFTNPNEEITGLEPGDIFVYEDVLTGVVVARVKETEWDGNTLVVYGDPEFDPGEAFEIIKIDDDAEANDFTTRHDENTGVPFAYDDVEEMENDIIAFDEENSAPSGSTTITGGITDEIALNDKTGSLAELYGKIGYGVSGSVTYYSYSLFKLEYLQVKAGAEAYLDGGFKVSTPKSFKIQLGHAEALLSGGLLKLEVDAVFKMKIAVTGSVYLKASAESMFTWDHGQKDEDNTKTTGNVEVGVKLEGEVYAGVSLSVAVTTATGLIKVEAEASTGSQLTLELDNDDLSIGGEIGTNPDATSKYDSKHSCAFCVKIKGERNFSLSVSLKIWKKPILLTDKETGDNEGKWTVFKAKWPMDSAYYSNDYHEFGWGSCPHRSYRVVVNAKSTNGQMLNAQNVKVYSRDADGKTTEVGTFNSKNTCQFFLPNGTYTIYASLNGVESYQTVTVAGKKVTVELRATSAADMAMSGTCGENVNWKLTTDGKLIISGTGPMDDYGMYWFDDDFNMTCDNPAPWWSTMEMMKKYPITSVVIQNGVTHIGDCAFIYAKLTEVTVPGSVESIGYGAFGSMSTLEEVTLNEGVQRIDTMAFHSCTALKKLSLPSTLIEIGTDAFSGCEALEKLELPDGLATIGWGAFNSCSSLEEIIIPGTVQSMGMNSFSGCAKLRKVTIWKGVREIGWSAFSNDTCLETVVIPTSVKTISYDVFDGCTALETVIYGGSEEEWNTIAFKSGNDPLQTANIQYNSEAAKTETSGQCGKNLTWNLSEDGVLTVHLKTFTMGGEMNDYDHMDTPWNVNKVQKVVVESGVTTIGAYAFNSCRNLTEVQLPASVDTIGAGAFGGCTLLKEVPLPTEGSMGVTTIKANAFADSGLEHITLPSTLTMLEPYAFNNATQLQSIALPWQITEIPERTFANCTSLASVTLPDGLVSIGKKAFSTCKALTSILMPDTVTSIGEEAFGTCSNLTSVTLPSSLTEIPDKAFIDCPQLDGVELPENLKKIGASAFGNAGLSSGITLPSTLESIGDRAFSFGKFTSIWIPDSVVEMGKGVFSYGNLNKVTLPNGIKTLPDEMFAGCEFTSFVIPYGVTTIGEETFSNCDQMESIQIPDTVTSIGKGAFASCSNLTTVVLPEGISEVEESLFEYCMDLEEITIPASVTSIEKNAFYWCFHLKTVHYTGKRTKWSNIAIADGNDELTTATLLCADDISTASLTENTIATGSASDAETTPHAVFNGLVENGEYAVIVSRSADDPLNADNLLYINQVKADGVGVLDIPFRTSAVLTEDLYVVACRQDSLIDDGDTPSSGGDGSGAIILIGGVAAVAAVAGVVLMMPVKVEGTVKLADQPVANATVQVLKGDAVKAETVTDANGHFTVKVKRGGYTLRVQWTDVSGQPMTRTVDFKAPDANLNVAA